MRVWHMMEKVSWAKHKTNEEVLCKVEEERPLAATSRDRQGEWIGRILRADSLLRTIKKGKLEGKRTRGRPRQMLLD